MSIRCPFLCALLTLFVVVEARAQTVDFNRDIRPILSNRCLTCHGPDEGQRQAGLRLDIADIATARLDSGDIAIVPGQPDVSTLVARITSHDESTRMPPTEFGKPLTDSEINTLTRWIEQGANYATHWSYVRIERPDIPRSSDAAVDAGRSEIDAFVQSSLAEHNLQRSPAAEPRTLVRRVFLDLIGLPPTVEESHDWTGRLTRTNGDLEVANTINTQVWAELVDHLLDRPEFGEHWARKWLDLARYADSSGYADDPARTIWPWRDWVIRSINSNMPFDQFTVEQLAGDLLPNPTEDQLVATAFHRNTMTNNEGGTQDEEFRNVAVVDRVNTTMAVWMGTTMACAQCHSHKYDPISQDEYFGVFAILNNTEDADRGDDSPRIQLYSPERVARKVEITARRSELDELFQRSSPELIAGQSAWEAGLKSQPAWIAAVPSKAATSNGGELRIAEDGTVSLATPAEKDTYSIELPVGPTIVSDSATDIESPQPRRIAAIQIEAIPDPGLTGGGAGHAGGNFVISELSAKLIPVAQRTPAGRYVRIEIPGPDQILSLAEVQIFSSGENIAARGKATQSSTEYNGVPERAIDGNTDGNYEANSVTHSARSESPWWELDLGAMMPLEKVAIWNRTGNDIHKRLANFTVTLLDESRSPIWTKTIVDSPNPNSDFPIDSVHDITFATAVADFSQDGFAAPEVFDGRTEELNGWAVGGRVAERHALTLVPKQPLMISEASTIQLTIEQQSPYAHHLLGRFRIQFTDDETAINRARIPGAILAIADLAPEARDESQSAELSQYFRDHVAEQLNDERAERIVLRDEQNAMKPDTSVPILRELAGDARRKTLLQFRGNYLDKGHEVFEHVPTVFPQPTPGESLNRLAFAKWLVSRDNPLTARVVVNRYWEHLFGRGLVATSEDFGSQGEPPTHPELLDWLSIELIESGWDTKSLLKSIVTSETYQQSSRVTSEAAAGDPDNRWLARGPRVRLSAEMVRDQALQAAGLLSHRMFGPPVKPPQPSLGLSAAFGSSTDWSPSTGEDRYRRAIYTTWRRSNPYPSMATFDAPNREVCTVRRNRTNTPLQALVTLNDPVYVEAAQALARLMLQQNGSDADRIAFGFERCLLRSPTSSESGAIEQLLIGSRKELADRTEDAMKLATEPLGPLPEGLTAIESAAMTIVANVLLNADEMFLKP